MAKKKKIVKKNNIWLERTNKLRDWISKNTDAVFPITLIPLLITIGMTLFIFLDKIDGPKLLNNGFWGFDSGVLLIALIILGSIHIILTIIMSEMLFLGKNHSANVADLVLLKTGYILLSMYLTCSIYMVYWIILLLSLFNAITISIILGVILLYIINIIVYKKIWG